VLNDLGLPLFIISHDRDFLKKTVTHLFRLEAGRIR
jgi:ATPase subunit of ABC transporter with duplicated ATPase domains